ncbi:MAG: ubiquitin carboxyl-terminal hydrolase family protein [Parachlamydiaceae bacterium]
MLYTSFKDAIINSYHILSEKTPKITGWFGKKVFLGYSEKKGWSVYQLGFLGQLFRKLDLAYHDTHQALIIGQLKNLNKQDIRLISTNYLSDKFPSLIKKFQELYPIHFQTPKANNEPHIRTPTLFTRSEEKPPYSDKNETKNRHKKITGGVQKEPTHSPSDSLDRHNEPIKPHKTEAQRPISSLEKENRAISPPLKEKSLPVKKEEQVIEAPPVTTPLSLENYKNRCYLDSVLEMLLSVTPIREKIFNECASQDRSTQETTDKESAMKQKKILITLRNLILSMDNAKKKEKEGTLLNGKDSPAEEVRNMIFASRLNPDLKCEKNLYTQQDASTILLLINTLLDHSFQTVEIDTPIVNGTICENLAAKRPIATNYKLELPFKENMKTREYIKKIVTKLPKTLDPSYELLPYRNYLIDLLAKSLPQVQSKNERSCLINELKTLQKGMATDVPTLVQRLNALEKNLNNHLEDILKDFFGSKVAAAASGEPETREFNLKNAEIAKLPFTSQTALVSLPDTLSLHVKRYECLQGVEKKADYDLVLPKEGIVDMTPYCSVNQEESYQYTITGYVVHHGNNLKSGHYTANIKIGNQFYHCDNCSPRLYEEISAEEFYGNTKAYLIFLKKIPIGSSHL